MEGHSDHDRTMPVVKGRDDRNGQYRTNKGIEGRAGSAQGTTPTDIADLVGVVQTCGAAVGVVPCADPVPCATGLHTGYSADSPYATGLHAPYSLRFFMDKQQGCTCDTQTIIIDHETG